jgi:hypothetical protein
MHTFIFNTVINLIIRKHHNKIQLRETDLVPNKSTSPQITAAEAHLAEGKFLHEEQTMNKEVSLL